MVKVQECVRIFFIKTLCIGKKTVETALRKNANKSTPLMDRRGKHQPHNRTPDTEKDTVRQHIEFFPTVESHYTRKDTDRKYLSSNLSIRKMHDLYRTGCMEKHKILVTEKVYRQVFCNEYNISFHRPKKDQCVTCNQYKQKDESGNIDESTKHAYQEHQKRKLQGRQEKENGKQRRTKHFLLPHLI